MKKSYLVLFVSGALVAIGMILSYTGASMISGQVTTKETSVNGTYPVTLEKELDPAIADRGAFVVRAQDTQKSSLVATVYGPSGEQIKSKKITGESTEEYFDISSKGVYKLEVQNSGEETPIVLGLTHMPDKTIILLNTLGQYMIITGFAGAIIAVIYAAASRKKSS